MEEAYFPVSLGNSCETKFQTSRVMQFRRDPETSLAAYRLMMLPPGRSADLFGWSIFEWQLTSFKGVCQYIERDFQGIFERADLAPGPLGCAHNRRLGAHHLHEFEYDHHKTGGAFTQDIIDRGYDAARLQLEERAETFRQIMRSPGPFLYIHSCQDIPTERNARKLVELLGGASPDHRFHVLFVGHEHEDNDLSALSGLVSKAYRPSVSGKPANREWEGDDEAWDQALAPFALRFSDGTVA
jgi:hypothetical protein